MRFNPSYAATLTIGLAALLFLWKPWQGNPETPDVVQRFSNMTPGDRMSYRIESAHCFGGSRTTGWIAHEADGWYQCVSRELDPSGLLGEEIDERIRACSVNYLGAVAASIHRLGPTRQDSGGWVDSHSKIQLDWNDDGHWDQEWKLSDSGFSLEHLLVEGPAAVK